MSFIENYQSRKNLLASNLQNKNVDASGTEGMTTLINKINDIEGVNKIFLEYIEENTFKATYIKNGVLAKNQEILFGYPTMYVRRHAFRSDSSVNLLLGEEFTLTFRNKNSNSGAFYIECKNDNNETIGKFVINYNGHIMEMNLQYSNIKREWNGTQYIQFKDGVLSDKNMYSYAMPELEGGNFYITSNFGYDSYFYVDCIGINTTNDNGECTFTYDELVNSSFQAKNADVSLESNIINFS